MFGKGNYPRPDSWSEKMWQAKDRLDQQHHIMDWTWHETTARQGTRQRSMEKAGS